MPEIVSCFEVLFGWLVLFWCVCVRVFFWGGLSFGILRMEMNLTLILSKNI